MQTNILSLIFFFFVVSCQSPQPQETNGTEDLNQENFHIYLLMGQSNMAGRGIVEPIDTISDPRVLMLSENNQWVPARSPLHADKPVAGTGLGLVFGRHMAKANPEITIGLVPCAKGGSSINHWYPDSLHQGTKSYPYRELMTKSKKALSEGTLKGILWHQGESDTKTTEDIAGYPEKFKALIERMSAELNFQEVPIVMGELGEFFTRRIPLAAQLNDTFRQIADQNKCIGLVSARGLQHKGDSVHFDSPSYRELGERYANQMIELQKICSNH